MEMSGRRWLLAVVVGVVIFGEVASGQLSTSFYDRSCPNLQRTIRAGLQNALRSDVRAGSSLLRMHFHDCFVNGCDGSVLLDDGRGFVGEKSATGNANSLRRFDLIDTLKSSVERICPTTVSCADILAIAARDAVVLAGGPSWNVRLGRRDSLTASLASAQRLPRVTDSFQSLANAFRGIGLDTTDLVALSGAHTFGKSQCLFFTNRLGGNDPTISSSFLLFLRGQCPRGGPGTNTVDLDQTTPGTFDNAYYNNLLNGKGLLSSDVVLQGSSASSPIVGNFARSQSAFFAQFITSIIKLGNTSPLTGSAGQIRTNCRFVNS